MSKQSEAKEKQGYVAKAIPQTCANCAHMEHDMTLPAWMQRENEKAPGCWGNQFKVASGHRCGLGGFAVKKMGTCNEWSAA